jgi:N-methylhydantoinase B
MITTIRGLQSGHASAISIHDPFPGTPDGIRIKVGVEIDSAAAMIDIDLRDNADCVPNGLNLTEATARTAAMVGTFNSIGATVPPNAGSFRRLRIHLRNNCVAGIPLHPASCSVATTNVADRVSNAVQVAFAQLADGIGMAEVGPVIPASAAVISGRDPRTDGSPFVNQLFLAITGGAGSPVNDGWLTIAHVGNGGMIRKDSVELDELTFPILIKEQRLIPDTEGAGHFRGAPSALVEYGPVGTSLVAAYGSDGAINGAAGARGGLAGAVSRHFRRDAGGSLHELPALALVDLKPGETIVSQTCGGGGYGAPTERDPEKVRHDVQEGWVTRGRARDVYGVVVGEGGEVDLGATATLRRTLRSNQ